VYANLRHQQAGTLRRAMASAENTSPGRDHLLQIGEVAERVGLSLRTVRYYEEMELLVPETRSEGGFRLYTEEQVDRLALIKQMKPLGFSVQEMRELLVARDALADRSLPESDVDAARATLREFAGGAAERSDELRAKADAGSAFAQQLRREARRDRR
jgi:DNA-binding transcriptional MerR regulator